VSCSIAVAVCVEKVMISDESCSRKTANEIQLAMYPYPDSMSRRCLIDHIYLCAMF
jgi:hypothetical protein